MLAKALSNTLFSTRNANTSASFGSFFSGLSGTSSTIQTDAALTLSALYDGVNIISNDIAVIPKAVYKNTATGKEKQSTHPINYILSKQSNRNQTAFHFHKIMIVTAILRGNAVAIINRNKQSGQIDRDNGFTFVHPSDLTDIRMVMGELYFITKFGTFHNSEVIHIKGFSTNGYTGISVLKHAAKNLNAAIKAESFAETNFDAKGFGLGIVKTPTKMTPNTKRIISESMESRLSRGGAFNIAVLDEGMDFSPISVSAKEAELIDWKKTTIQDIARWLNIGTDKLKQTEYHNYSTIEQASINHLQDCLIPWVVQLEQEYSCKVFNDIEKQDHYIKCNTNSVLRSDIQSRSEYYSKMRFGGILSGDEIREKEDYNATGLEYMTNPLQPVQIQQQSQIDALNVKK
jgi:HK97 family phage portal protein